MRLRIFVHWDNMGESGVPMSFLSTLRGDFYGGLTAAIVALPLSLAFGMASGAGAEAGLYGAIAIGFFAALFGGTPTQISGPTGPMAVLMAGIMMTYQHDPAMAFTVVMLAGLFQILFGVLKVGKYMAYVPYSVISGFMSGIGLLIIILQFAPLTGHAEGGTVLQAAAKIPGYVNDVHGAAFCVGMIALLVMMFLPKKIRLYVPPPLAALVAAGVAGLLLFPGAPTLGDIPEGLPRIQLPTFTIEALPGMLASALMLGLVGAIDSLLVSLVADNFTRGTHKPDRELIGQGIGNMAAGLVGGIAGSGATMRTVINIRAGGRTRLSGVLHALILLGCLLGLGQYVEDIPKAVLAGILIKVGWDIIDWPFLKRLYQAGPRKVDREVVAVMVTVMGLTVFVDLITAVAVGIIMKSLITARRLSRDQMENITFAEEGGALIVRFSGALTFGTANDLAARLRVSLEPRWKKLTLDFGAARLMDLSIMVAIANLLDAARENGMEITLTGQGNPVFQALEDHGIFKNMGRGSH